MKLGSLFDGSGGFPLAGMIHGIYPVWASEIEPYPMRVTEQRIPWMKQLGDVNQINGAEIEPVDIVTFGSPCQDLSVAGLRQGIHDGERSNLFFEAIRIIKEMRDHDRATGRADVDLRPRFAVWENVPGAFSSNGGEDFRAVLQAFCDIMEDGLHIPRPKKWNHAGCVAGNGWSLAWRVYDAQYWPGTPQRRKRIYLVADFASERAGEILFERESVSGDTQPGGEAWERTAADAEGGTQRSDCHWLKEHGALAEDHGLHNPKGEVAATLQTKYHYGDGGDAAIVARVSKSSQDAETMPIIGEANCSSITGGGIAGTLDASYYKGPGNRSGKEREIVAIKSNHANGRKYILRRLTPTECARLQGFPDWWCDGVNGSDSAQYKMWGNGIALPCAVDVLGRITKAIEDEENL